MEEIELSPYLKSKFESEGWTIRGEDVSYGAIGVEYTVTFRSPRLEKEVGVLPFGNKNMEQEIRHRESEAYYQQIIEQMDKEYYKQRRVMLEGVKGYQNVPSLIPYEIHFDFVVKITK